MKNPQVKTKTLRAIEITGIHTDVFQKILKSLKKSPTSKEIENGEGDNYGGWTLPLSKEDASPDNDAEGYVVLFPSCIEYSRSRKLIFKSLGIKLDDYDVIAVHDCR